MVWQDFGILMPRKDLAMGMRRGFNKEFKRRVVEEWLSGAAGPAQLSRKYEVAPGLLYHWKRQFSRGRYGNEPTTEGAMADRIKELERLVGRLTFENELLKKAVQVSVSRREKSGSWYPSLDGGGSNGGAK
jgi:transposase